MYGTRALAGRLEGQGFWASESDHDRNDMSCNGWVGPMWMFWVIEGHMEESVVWELGVTQMVCTQPGGGWWGHNGQEHRASILCMSVVVRLR